MDRGRRGTENGGRYGRESKERREGNVREGKRRENLAPVVISKDRRLWIGGLQRRRLRTSGVGVVVSTVHCVMPHTEAT